MILVRSLIAGVLLILSASSVSCENQVRADSHNSTQRKAIIDDSNLTFRSLSAQFSSNSLGRALQMQAELWQIQDPEFSYYDHQFVFKWRVSDYIQDRFTSFRIYDGRDCADGSNDITDAISDYYNNVYLQNLGLQPDANTPYYNADGQGFRDFRLFLDVQPTAAESPIFYYTNDDNQLNARIEFCIRYSLYNDDFDDPDSMEVNFQETLVTFTADLTDGFEITTFAANPKEQNEETAYLECEIIAYECDNNNKALSNPGYLR
jgi:hypothetical protein